MTLSFPRISPTDRYRNSRIRCAQLFAMVLLVLSVTAHAQFGSSLTGTVTDGSGGAVPGATAILTDEGTQQSVTRTSSGDGVFQFPSIGAGRYDLTVTAKGFKPATFKAVVVSQDTPRNFDVALSVGGDSQTVTVDASDTVALQSSDASVGTVIDSEQIQKVPSYGRDPYNLVRTAPGITGDGARAGNGTAVFLPNSVGPGGSNFGVAATENTVQIAAAGQRITDNNFLVDGVSVNSLGYGGATVINPNIEAIGSIQVVSTSFSAEDGRNSGAQIKIVTKSGTNQIHGSAFFQYDEPGLNAYNKYGGLIGTGALPTRVSTKSRDYAASLGGPIIKDKLFAFASFEGISQKLESFSNAFIETAQYRAAIHASRPNSVADQIVNAPGGIPVVRNVLTQSCLTPVNQNQGVPGTPTCQAVTGGLDVGSPVPLSNNGGTGYAMFAPYNNTNQIQIGNGLDGIPDIQYVQLDASQTSTARQYNGRVDYYLTPHDQFAGSAYVTKLYRVTPSDTARPNQALPFDPTNIATTFIYIHTFAPTLLNEFRANYTLFAENGVHDAQAAGVDLGIPFIELQNSFYTTNNKIHFGANAGTTSPGIFAENQYEIRDTVTKLFGSHTLKIGFEGRSEQNNNNLVGGGRPTFTFAGLWNFFNDRPIYEGVSANPATGGQPIVNRYLDDHYYSLFVQHDWKASRELTLNMGLRWEYYEPIYNKGQNINYPVLGTTPGRELVDATLQPHNHLWNSQYKNFLPKVGFALSPNALHNKTVIRGGFALAFNRLDDVLFDPALEDGPGVFSYGICCATANGDFGSPAVASQFTYQRGTSKAYNSFPSNPALKTPIGANGLPTNGVAIEAYGALPNLPQPYSYLYSLEVQNDLGKQFVLAFGFQGSTGRHYSRLVNQVFISPQTVGTSNNAFGNGLYIAHNDSNIYYNGLNVHAQKHYKRGLSLDGTYTYSKAMDQVSSGDGADGNANQTDPAHNSTELGPSDFDVRHRLVAIGTYEIGYYHGGSELLKLALNGWQANGIFTAHTGFPYTPTTYRIQGIPLTPTSATIGPVRPEYFHGTTNFSCNNDNYRNGKTVTGQFGVAPVAGGAAPGIGRNSFRGPCYQDIDLGIAKEVPLHALGEHALFRFQVQAFNLFNKLNFSPYTFGGGGPGFLDNSIDANGNYTPTNAGTATAFSRPTSASAGRVVEFNARVSF
jgi:hypothetical protein